MSDFQVSPDIPRFLQEYRRRSGSPCLDEPDQEKRNSKLSSSGRKQTPYTSSPSGRKSHSPVRTPKAEPEHSATQDRLPAPKFDDSYLPSPSIKPEPQWDEVVDISSFSSTPDEDKAVPPEPSVGNSVHVDAIEDPENPMFVAGENKVQSLSK